VEIESVDVVSAQDHLGHAGDCASEIGDAELFSMDLVVDLHDSVVPLLHRSERSETGEFHSRDLIDVVVPGHDPHVEDTGGDSLR
jgi:hypothetical protein